MSLLSFTPTSQARVGLAGRDICPAVGKESFRADARFLEVGGENGPPHNPDQPAASRYRPLRQPRCPAAHAAVPITPEGRCVQLLCLPLIYPSHHGQKEPPNVPLVADPSGLNGLFLEFLASERAVVFAAFCVILKVKT